MQGETNSGDPGAVGVLGRANASPAGPGSVGVRGINSGTGSYGIGVWGSQAGSGYGVYGTAPTGFGVVGESASGWAGYFNGNVYVNGTLSKAAGVAGAYVAASRAVCDLLVNRARTLVFSTALPPALACAALESMRILAGPEGDERRARRVPAPIDLRDAA